VDSFNEFVNKTSADGLVVYHADLPIKTDKKHVTYGLENADVTAQNIRVIDGETCFDVVINQSTLSSLSSLRSLKMTLYGNHNVQNALAAIIVCTYLGVNEEDIRMGLATFKGVQRRFDIRVKDARHIYVDDYAHHPEEIKAALSAARKAFSGKELTVVFQPHLFTRTRDFMDGFAESLSLADRVILLDIYPARELPIEGVTSAALLEKITSKNKMLCSKEELLETIKGIDPELIMTVGAGDIDRFVPQIEKMLAQ
jgi:UDP-N-acetylmuramate--alanine ligase